MPTAPAADELDNWAQENYSLSASAAASLGFPVGSLTATVQRDALMFGSSRWKDVVAGEHTYRFGLALRALVVVSDIKGSGALTLPLSRPRSNSRALEPRLSYWYADTKATT
jgi:hypothetical protein